MFACALPEQYLHPEHLVGHWWVSSTLYPNWGKVFGMSRQRRLFVYPSECYSSTTVLDVSKYKETPHSWKDFKPYDGHKVIKLQSFVVSPIKN